VDSSIGMATRYGLDVTGIESLPIPVAERSKASICDLSVAGITGLNLTRGMEVVSVVLFRQMQNPE
jgi:hypothetical protein